MKKQLLFLPIFLIISILSSCTVFKANKKQMQLREIQALKMKLEMSDSLLDVLNREKYTLQQENEELNYELTIQQTQLNSANSPKTNDSDGDASFDDVGDSNESSGTDEWGFSEDNSLSYSPTSEAIPFSSQQNATQTDSIRISFKQEEYGDFIENEFINSNEKPTSTFSIDADGASYANLKRYVTDENQLPPANSIRLEEMINYFQYDYPNPEKGKPIFVDGEISDCPWNAEHKLVRIGFKGKNYDKRQCPSSNLVFLIDVSGSMSRQLPLVIQSFELLVNELSPNDKVAIVVYAGAERLELPSTSVSNKALIIEHLHNLVQGGSTNGAKGIITAYQIAQENFIPNANNRVILATDGDFNVGISDTKELIKLIEKERESGIFLSVIGCGTDNYNDEGLEALADHGNGVYEYLNTIEDANKIFVQEFDKFFTVAKDVKIQIDFNPQMVSSYRLIGYENRLLNKEDFTDDTKDAGDLSAGQSLTALYEIVPAKRNAAGKKKSIRALQINFRYKEPNEAESKLISVDVLDNETQFEAASENLRFAATVASLGMFLRNSKFKGTNSLEKMKEWAYNALEYDELKYRRDFVILLQKIQEMNLKN